MKWFAAIIALSIIALVSRSGLQSDPATYHVQFIRGTDQDQSPAPDSKRIPPHLAGAFHAVFKWKTYWEITSREVELEAGHIERVRLNPEREVEIDLTDPSRRAVSAFLNGKRVQRTVCPRGDGKTLIGGDRDGRSAWFILVSRKSAQP